MWAYAGFQATQGYLQSQGIVKPPMLTNLSTALLHPLWTWLLMYPLGEQAQSAPQYPCCPSIELGVMPWIRCFVRGA